MRPGEVEGGGHPVGSCAVSAGTGQMKHHLSGSSTVTEPVKKWSYCIFVGIDLGSRLHQAWVLDRSGEFLGECGFEHTAEGLAHLVEWLFKLSEAEATAMAVAIETPHGAVVDCLLEHGIAVYTVNPKQVDRYRDRHAVSGAKDDRRDAMVLADALRTDGHRFQPVRALSAELIRLREQLRIDEELCGEEVMLANRVREQLFRCWPHLLELAPANLVQPFFWEVLERFVKPDRTCEPEKEQIQALLVKHRIRRLGAERALTLLRMPALPAAAGTLEAALTHIDLLLKRLRLAHEQRLEGRKHIDALLKGLMAAGESTNRGAVPATDAAILSSLPGVGRTVLATVLTQAAEVLRERDLAAFRALGGIAPVTKKSGKLCLVNMRKSRNRALNHALYHWARNAIKKDPHFREHYERLRGSGHFHARALRGVMDRILSIAMAMLRQGQLYDPSRRARQK
jgi:transposase